jgi:hypothetical protein
MEAEPRSIPIRLALPTLEAAAINHALVSLSAENSVDTLLQQPNRERLCNNLAGLLSENPCVPLAVALPGLEQIKQRPIANAALPVRVINVFEKANIKTWKDVLGMSPGNLLALRNLGERSLEQFLAYAVYVSAEALVTVRACASTLTAPDASPLQQELSPCFRRLTAELGHIVQWARYETSAKSFGDLEVLSIVVDGDFFRRRPLA